MHLQGKTILFLGDSITQGCGASTPENGYVSVFQRLSHAHVVNYGISGTRIARQKNLSENSDFDQNFLQRADTMQPNADVVVVFGGTNDFGHGDADLGDFQSRSEYTFYGAMHQLCEKLLNRYPDATIVFLTPLHRLNEDDTVTSIGLPTVPLCRYVAAIQEVAGFYGLPVLDLFHTSGLQPKVPAIQARFMPDGLHPSDAGAERLAQRILGFLSAL